MADQPAWNPSDKDADVTLSGSNRTWSMVASTFGSVRSTASVSSGKWRVQLLHVTASGSANRHGFATSGHSLAIAPGEDTVSWAINGQGNSVTNSVDVDLAGNYANGGVVNLYIDVDNGKAWYGDSTGPFSGDPAAGTGAHHTFTPGTTVYLCDGMDGGGSTRGGTLRLLADYTGSPPTGFTDGWGGATVYSGTAVLAGAGTLAASPRAWLGGAAALAGVGSLAGAADRRLPISGVLAGSGAVTVPAVLAAGAAALLPGVGTIVPTVVLEQTAQGTLVGEGSILALADRLLPLAALLAGEGATIAVGTIYGVAAGTLQGAGALDALAAALATAEEAAAGAGGLDASGGLNAAGEGSMAGQGGILVDAGALRPAEASLPGVGDMPTLANIQATATATLPGVGTLDSVVTPIPGGTFSLFGEGHLYALGSVVASFGTVTLDGQGDLTVDAAGLRAASVEMTGVGALSAVGDALRSGSAALDGAGGMVPASVVLAAATAVLVGAGVLEVDADVVGPADIVTVILPGVGTITAGAAVFASVSISMSGSGSMAVEAEGGSTEPTIGELLAAWSIRQGWVPEEPPPQMRVPIKAVAETAPSDTRAAPKIRQRGKVVRVAEPLVRHVAMSAVITTGGATCFGVAQGASPIMGKVATDSALAKAHAPGGAIVLFGKAVSAPAEAHGTMGGKALIRGSTRADDDALAASLIALIAA